MTNPKFTIFKGVNNQFYFNLKAENGEKILSSEGYIAKAECKEGIQSVKENSLLDGRYERKNSYMNYTFNLKASNGRIIGRSENYTTEANRENGIAAVKRVAHSSPIEDLT